MAEGWNKGDKIGRFRLEEKVGSGGFGETWRAHDELLDVEVALKVFSNVDPERRDRYVREARALAHHSSEPGIASVRDLIEVDGDFCLVMDYIAGEDLSDVVKRQGKLSLEQTITVLDPVATALDHLHEEGMVHRDVSPDNVRVAPDGTGTLLDFGSVLGADQREGVTVTVRPGFAPPEQFGDAASQGSWTDVYALAATAYCCLCGFPPADSLQRTFSDTLKRPSELGVKLPATSENALMNALALDYHKRTQHVGDLLQGLRAQVVAPATSAAERSWQTTSTREDSHTTSTGEKAVPAVAEKTSTKTTPTSTQARRPTRKNESRQPREGRSLRKVRLALLMLIPVVLIASVLMLARAGSSGSVSGDLEAEITDQAVNPDVIDEATRNAGVTEISFKRCAISDEAIQQLSKHEQVTAIDIDTCTGFTDLEPLASLPNLTYLSISGMESADLAKLFPKNMPTIEHLVISMASVTNDSASALSHFTGLTRLELTPVAGIRDISFVSAMPKLEQLDLSGIDLSGNSALPLAQAKAMKVLSLNQCKLSAIDFVSNMPDLETLQVVDNQVSDLSPLTSCPKLMVLWMSQNQVHDLAPLEECPQLLDFVADGNGLSSARGVGGHEKLRRISLADNKLTSTDGLEDLPDLEELSLARNQLSNVMALASCEHIERLSLASNIIENLDVCERLTQLEQLNASHNQLSDISKLASCSQLEYLALQDNQIESIDVLDNDFIRLTTLNVSFNQLTSVAPLAKCAKLRYLIMNDNQVTTLDGLQDKPELNSLLASNNQLTDISALESSTGVLENLDLGNNQISDISCLSKMGSAGKYATHYSILLDRNQLTSAEGLPFGKEFRVLALHANPLTDLSLLSRNNTDWYTLYLPYSAEIDYGQLGEIGLTNVTRIVDVPYDQQNNLTRSMGIGDGASAALAPRPQFVTAEEAENELKVLRDNVNERVSGIDRTASIGTEASEEVADLNADDTDSSAEGDAEAGDDD